MADISRHLEKADKYLQKGKQDAALEEFLAALREDPRNDGVRQSAADLCLSVGRSGEAAGLLGELFEHEAAAGDTARAVATYKKLARVATPAVDHTYRYAQFIERSNKRESIESYNSAVQGFIAAGRKSDALPAMRRIVALEPSIDNYRREGELAAELHDMRGAALAFLQVAQLEDAVGSDSLPWYQRAHSLDNTNPDIALAYGNCLLARGTADDAIQILKPFAGANNRQELREAYVKSLIATSKFLEAEPLVWELFTKNPKLLDDVATLLAAYMQAGQYGESVRLARKLQDFEQRRGNQREFVALLKDLSDKIAPGPEFLEYMAQVYNESNREHDYCDTLLKLFEVYFASRSYVKAANCLDRAAEVDAYETGHAHRLEMLRGKIDGNMFNAIANRLSGLVKLEEHKGAGGGGEEEPAKSGDSETTILEDLMLQAEIFLQYSMRSKALERLERINKLFPREEERSEKLRQLYLSAGFNLHYTDAPPAPPRASTGTTAMPVPNIPVAPPPQGHAPDNEAAVDNFAKVTDITRNIYRQSSVKSVLFTAVNDIGRHWQASRCVAGLCTPGKPPSSALEYCSPEVKASDVMAMVKLLTTCQTLALKQGVLDLPHVASVAEFEPIRAYVEALEVQSLLGVPLLDGEDPVGMLLLEQTSPRTWRNTDAVVLRTISEQMVLAVNYAKLRSLVKTLAVTDEKSGLLKRSSYLDVLLSEVRRSLQQGSPCSIMLLHFGKTATLVREFGESAVDGMVQQAGQIITSHVRQNDVAVRYDLTTIALILADTGEKNAFFVVDKLKKVMTGVHLPGKETQCPITIGIAEAVMQTRFDPVDIVTEVINRAEAALEAAKTDGGNTARSIAAQMEGAAVA